MHTTHTYHYCRISTDKFRNITKLYNKAQQDIHHLHETTQRKEDTIRDQQEEICCLQSQIKNFESLQVHNNILSRQLTESQVAKKDTERALQDIIQQEIHRLQEKQSKLEETHSQLKVLDSKLQETRSQLEETQSELQNTHVELQHVQQNFRDSQQQTGIC